MDGAAPDACGEPANEHLMACVQAGDVAAFQVLVRRHTRGVQQFARRLLRNVDDAEDVTQDTMLRLWQHAARWEPQRAQFTTWLYRIAHNQCIDRLRRRQVRGHEAHDGAELDALPDQRRGATPDERTADDARARRLDAALAALPERQRSALVLSFYQGFSAQKAAAVLDVSVEALESLLARARRTLRSALADLRAGADE